MITLHLEKDLKCIGNGIAILDDYIINPVIEEVINNKFSFEFEMLASTEIANMIESRMQIKAPTPLGDEIFRVRMIEKSMEDYDKVLFYCSQNFFCDMEDNFIEDTNIVGKTGYGALEQLQANTLYPHNFTFYSDISTVNNARIVRKNFTTALIGDDDNSYLSRWGGELEVNRYDIKMLTRRGEDRGVSILYRKNLLGLNSKVDYTSYYTRVMPEGYNGLFLEEKYVDSNNIDLEHPIVRLVEFPDIKVKENEDDEEGYSTIEEAREALRIAAEKLFTESKVDEPEATYEVEFQELSQTEEYKDYAVLERVFLGDTVHVKHEEIGINVTARCLEYKYNPKTKSYISITLGNITSSFTSETAKKQEEIINKVEENKNSFQIKLENAIKNLTDLINSGLYGHCILTGNELLIMDTTDINTAREVWRYNINGFGYSSTGYNGPFIGLTKDGKLLINEVTAYKFTASLLEAGIIKSINGNVQLNLDDDFFEVTHTDSTTKTRIGAEGFYLLDSDNEIFASFSTKESWSELKADKVLADNIDNVYIGDSNLYVNHSYVGESDGSIDKPFSSFSMLNENLNRSRIINKTLNINVLSTGNVTEMFYLSDLYGTGVLNITLANSCTYQGENTRDAGIKFNNVKLIIKIVSACLFNNFLHGALFYNCGHVTMTNEIFNVPNYGVLFSNTNGVVSTVDFASSYCAIGAEKNSTVYVLTVAGNAGSGGTGEAFRSLTGSHIIVGTTASATAIPKGTTRAESGLVTKIGTCNANGSWAYPTTNPVPSAPTGMTYNQSFNATSKATYQYAWGSWSSGECKSGVYSSYGDKAGHLFFDLTSIRTFLNSGTVTDGATITLTRANSGGSSGGVSISVGGSSCSSASGTPSYSNKGTVGTLSWGQTANFTLSKAIVDGIKNGTINSITTHGSGYSNITACSINLKIQK